MPDCVRVHRSYWLPFMRDVLKIDNRWGRGLEGSL
jgi:hypothetical protein